MTTLDKRLDRLESIVLPEDELLYCTIYIEEDGSPSDLQTPNPRCPHALALPVEEICEKCRAHKIIFQFVGGYEE